MTIISVVCVPEGIAMTADSRLIGSYTRDNGVVDRFTFSDNAQKLLLIRNSTLGVSFCGDALIEGRTVADFLRIFDMDQVKSTDSIPEVARKLKDALDFAEFIVTTTILYLRFSDGISSCGGPVDSLVLTKDYAKFLKHKILQPN